LRHPCVCSLLGVCLYEHRPSMVLEFLAGGSLHDLLHGRGGSSSGAGELDDMLIARIVNEVASGVAYLHSHGVMHRDVKSANVLLDESQHAKVADFGISTHFGRADYTAETGTYRQMAPEVILHKPYNYKCDVYSYGVLLWEVLHRQVPFIGFAPLQAAFAVAMEQARPKIDLRPELADYQELITQCWDAEPDKRPGMDSVVQRTAKLFSGIEHRRTLSQQQQQQPQPQPQLQQQQQAPVEHAAGSVEVQISSSPASTPDRLATPEVEEPPAEPPTRQAGLSGLAEQTFNLSIDPLPPKTSEER